MKKLVDKVRPSLSTLASIANGEPRVKHRKAACIMAQQSTLEVGNAIIALNGMNDPFRDGHTTGYLEFYDERHRPSFPLTSQVIAHYLTMMMNEPSVPSLWKVGRITGWIEALVENAPHTFRSRLLEERITTLQEA